ncbi:MAG: ABC transporter substrate-binding protein [Coriobacteriales bacterium]|jgi:iron complex transport system substrate-binding protein|nr:ABC transporter substrate-binding protein [Coriobacteriales bacterium]
MADRLVLSRKHFIELVSGGALCALALGVPREAFGVQVIDDVYDFVDSLGRGVSIPSSIERVTPMGICAQTMLCTLLPEKLASVAVSINEAETQEYLNAGMGAVTDLPETGTAIKSEATGIDLGGIEAIVPSIILDIGTPKEELGSRLDALQEETGRPCVFLDISFGKLPEAYRKLGQLLGCGKRAEKLASYIEGIYSDIEKRRTKVLGSCKVLYASGELGLHSRGSASLQADVISFIGAVPIVTPHSAENGTIDFGALASEDVGIVLFDDADSFDSLCSHEGEAYEIWSSIPAVQSGRVAVSPGLFHSWLGSLVLVQAIGTLWLASVLCPMVYDYDMAQKAEEFYGLFYGLETDAETTRELVNKPVVEGYAHG